MKASVIVTAPLLATSASAFVSIGRSIARTRRNTRSSSSLNSAPPSRINHNIELDSPKVATQAALQAGDKKVYCRCWQSGTFPLCDGSHNAHNKETGDNVGPLIVSVSKTE